LAKNLKTPETPSTESLVVPAEVLGSGDKRLPVLSMEHSRMFALAVHPDTWQVVGEDIVPILTTFRLTEGVNGIPRGQLDPRTGEVRLSLERFRTSLLTRGWILIPHNAAPNKVSYMKRIESLSSVLNGHVFTAYITIFETAYAGAKHTHRNMKELNNWLKSLVGVYIDPPTPDVLRILLSSTKDAKARVVIEKAMDAYQGVAAEITDGGVQW
jgi:hypothetical protein